MKKQILILVIAAITLSCSNSDDSTEQEAVNPFKGNSFTADDVIASVIYGDGCTTTIEFINETECQEIQYIPNGTFKGTEVYTGTYTYNGNTVEWSVDEGQKKRTGTLSGSILTGSLSSPSGPYIYSKD